MLKIIRLIEILLSGMDAVLEVPGGLVVPNQIGTLKWRRSDHACKKFWLKTVGAI